jgi:hypothetical protein
LSFPHQLRCLTVQIFITNRRWKVALFLLKYEIFLNATAHFLGTRKEEENLQTRGRVKVDGMMGEGEEKNEIK